MTQMYSFFQEVQYLKHKKQGISQSNCSKINDKVRKSKKQPEGLKKRTS